ncbi:MAG: serine hydrolase [Bacteroidota bacterium]
MLRNALLLLGLALSVAVSAQEKYFPARGAEWETRTPRSLGLDANALQEAVDFAEANEYSGPKDLRQAILQGFLREPDHDILGPTKMRGGPAGMIIKDGFVVAQWGDVKRVDMTFSVTKSYLSTVAGLAYDDGLIDLHQPVANWVWDGTYDGEHNSKITWDHLLTQSSDWSGALFGLYDWADRPPREGGIDEWSRRELHEPGTHYKYNDVRVNILAYSLLQVYRKPLPQVIKERVMDPIGASTTWRWYGYDNTWVNVDGAWVQSVSGGGHHGGGLFISAEDHARFGLLFLNEGRWDGQQLISNDWVELVQQSSEANSSYGYMWWLNRGGRQWDVIKDESIYYAAGFGGNFIVVDKANDMVVVTRWLEPNKLGDMMELVRGAVK